MGSMPSALPSLDVATTDQVTQVKNFIQNFNKADGIDANSDYNNLYRMGETFHFNPQLVGYPLVWKANFDTSYKSFYEHYSTGIARRAPKWSIPGPTTASCTASRPTEGTTLGGTELWSYVPYCAFEAA